MSISWLAVRTFLSRDIGHGSFNSIPEFMSLSIIFKMHSWWHPKSREKGITCLDPTSQKVFQTVQEMWFCVRRKGRKSERDRTKKRERRQVGRKEEREGGRGGLVEESFSQSFVDIKMLIPKPLPSVQVAGVCPAGIHVPPHSTSPAHGHDYEAKSKMSTCADSPEH